MIGVVGGLILIISNAPFECISQQNNLINL